MFLIPYFLIFLCIVNSLLKDVDNIYLDQDTSCLCYSILILDLHERILNHHCVIYQRIWALSDPYFSRIFIFIEDSVLIREKGGQWKSVFQRNLRSACSEYRKCNIVCSIVRAGEQGVKILLACSGSDKFSLRRCRLII